MLFSSLLIALAGLANMSGVLAQDSDDSAGGSPQSAWHMDSLKLLAIERLDSIVSPNQVASHMHEIVGGSKMGASYNFQEQIASRCTTAGVTADKSNYWKPKLYWINGDGSFVPLPARHRFYYFLSRQSPVEGVQPFPEGLRMLRGNPNAKSAQGVTEFFCIINSDLTTGTIKQDNFNFDRDCPYGIRMDTMFPNCWNGVDLYKADGSHMSFPANTDTNRDGSCPWTHPIRIPSVMLEYTYLPSSWAPGVPTKGNLIWANGDTTGYGVHADFVNGWDTAVLAKALNSTQCVGSKPSEFRHMAIQECEVFAPLWNPNTDCAPEKGQMNEPSGASVDLVPIDSLPGCNPVWGSSGSKPGCSTAPPSPNVAAWQGTDGSLVATGSQNKARVLPTTPGWQNVGCIIDSWTGMLTGRTTLYYDTKLEPKSCAAACTKQGFSWALMGQKADYRWDCTCGEGISPTASNYPGMCNAPCPGNSTATCGAYTVHSVWYAPPGTTVDYQAANASDKSYTGCYYNTGSDSLSKYVESTYNDAALTTASCLQTCTNRNATWAATTNGKTCMCGSDLHLGTGYYVADSTCNMGCSGNSSETCGYTYGYSVYNLTASSYTKVDKDHPVDWVGCFNDPGGSTGLTAYTWTSTAMTPQMCTYGCADIGYSLAGLVFGNRCRCDNTWKGGAKYPSSTCNAPCTGNSTATCGGQYLTEVYNTVSAAKQVAVDIAARPPGWKGCYYNQNGAIMKDLNTYDGGNTVERCMATCSVAGYAWGAPSTQYYCRCSNTDPTNVSTNPKLPSNVYCQSPCPGNAKETCGNVGQWLEAYKIADYEAASNITAPTGWVGCYAGSTGLTGATWSVSDNSVDACTTGCKELGYTLSGMYGQQCFCGNSWDLSKGAKQADFQCSTACPGDSKQTCGGYKVTSVWNSSIGAETTAKSQTGYIGCYADNASNRALKNYTYTAAGMTNANCKLTCSGAGYSMAATANGNQCYCGNTINGGYNTYVSSAQCSTPCGGSSTSQCGGPNNRVSMFNATVPNAASNSTGSSSPNGYGARGCYTDTSVLATGSYSSTYMTVNQCLYYCKGIGQAYAGLTQGNLCRCGNTSPIAVAQMSSCDVPCVSNSSQTCGASARIQVYETSKSSLFTDPYAAVPGSLGCYIEAGGSIMLNMTRFTSSTLTQLSCAANCYAQGAKFSATKGSACYCGSGINPSFTRVSDANCNVPCPGDSSAVCGGTQLVSIRAALAPGAGGSASASASASRSASASAGASASAAPSSAAIEGLKGCYAPGSVISSATVKFTHDTMTPGFCRRYCRVNGLGVAALGGGNACYCGQTSQLGTKWPDAACTLSCKGDPSAKCGDVSLVSVYDTVGQGARYAPGYPTNFVGCFGDTTPRRLGNYSFTSTSMTADLCRRTCSARGLPVYGTQSGNQCFCGTTQPLTQTFDANCNSACAGNSTEFCGGSWKLSLYNANFALDSYSPNGNVVASSSAPASASSTTSKASSAVASSTAKASTSSSTTKASTAAASTSTSKASSAAAASPSTASTSTSKASSAAAASPSKASSAAAVSPSKASSAAAVSPSKASSAAASPAATSKTSSAAASQATGTPGGGLAASPSPSPVTSSSKPANSPSTSSRASSAAASPSVVATSRASSAAAVSSSVTPTTSSTQSAPSPGTTNHLGCYAQGTPIFKNSVITCDVLTPAMCKVWCDGNNYQYAGMTNGTTCGCSNTITALTQTSTTTCSKACFSDTTAKCGGEPGTYNVWQSSNNIARRNHRRRMRQVRGSHHRNQGPMSFNSEEEIMEFLKRQQMSLE